MQVPHCEPAEPWAVLMKPGCCCSPDQRTLTRHSILVTSLFKEKCIPGKRKGHNSLFYIKLIPLSPLGQGENKAWAGPVVAKAPSGILSRKVFAKHQCQHCKGGTRRCPQTQPSHILLLSRLTGQQAPQAALCQASSAVPTLGRRHEGCSLEEHQLFEALCPNRIFNDKVVSYIIIHHCRHLRLPEEEHVGLDCSVISWSCRKHSATSAFRDGLSISNKPSSEQRNLS